MGNKPPQAYLLELQYSIKLPKVKENPFLHITLQNNPKILKEKTRVTNIGNYLYN